MSSGVDDSYGVDSASLESRRMAEYADQLRSWLGQAYQWQCIPYYAMPSILMHNRFSPLSQNPTTFTNPVPNAPQQQQPAGAVPQTPSGNTEPQLIVGISKQKMSIFLWK